MRLSIAILSGLLVAVPAVAAEPRSWVDQRAAGVRLVDLSAVPAEELPLGGEVEVPLGSLLEFRGSLYDTLVVGPRLGAARLERADGDASLRLEALGASLLPGPDARVQLRRSAGTTAVRWSGLVDAFGAPAAFETLVTAPNLVGYQYLQVPPSVRRAPQQAAIEIVDTADPSRRATPSADGFVPAPGAVVVFPGDLDWQPMTGCDVVAGWCPVLDAYRAATGRNCREPSGHGDETACGTIDAKLWHFNEGHYCESCPYTFYVTVECGTEMHLPFRDMEGNQVRITDVFTGVQLPLEGINDCAKVPFRYCDNCNGPFGGGLIPRTAAGCQVGVPEVDCIPYLQRSTTIQWGWPLTDRDGDTAADDLPCDPPNRDTCTGNRSGAYAGHEEQNTDVILKGDPALCGVFRLDITSGGYHWYLAANCNGVVPDPDDPATIEQNFRVYQNCADALQAFDPVTELVITSLEFAGVCPDIEVVVEVTNIGCVDSTSAPVHLEFSAGGQPDIDTDLGVVAAGTSVTRRIPVNLRQTPQTVTATVDFFDVVSECNEQPQGSFAGCQPASGADTLAISVCSCANTVQAQVADTRFFSCDGQPATIDASLSSAVPCAGGQLEFQFLDGAGAVVRPWSTEPTFSVVPARCPSRELYDVQVRCSTETGIDCIDTIRGVEVECAQGRVIEVAASPTSICEGELVQLSATAGFLTYSWTNGRTGRVIQDRPSVDTSYQVTGTDVYGCSATGSVLVTVQPDPMPGPLGNTLRCHKEGNDVAFEYRELAQPVAGYELLLHAADGSTTPCSARAPVEKPWPAVMQAAVTIDSSLPGDPMPALSHVDGVISCPKLLFYKVVATSPCTKRRGPACDGFPRQLPPCP